MLSGHVLFEKSKIEEIENEILHKLLKNLR